MTQLLTLPRTSIWRSVLIDHPTSRPQASRGADTEAGDDGVSMLVVHPCDNVGHSGRTE
jgi:hypothetical protein